MLPMNTDSGRSTMCAARSRASGRGSRWMLSSSRNRIKSNINIDVQQSSSLGERYPVVELLRGVHAEPFFILAGPCPCEGRRRVSGSRAGVANS
jgi:hypothetical protein